MKKVHISLSTEEKTSVEKLLKSNDLTARVFKRATALLLLDSGNTLVGVGEILKLDSRTIGSLRDKYNSEGLNCLYDKPRSGRPVEIDKVAQSKITALACSTPPEGYSRWTLQLLADKSVALGYCEHISDEWVGKILKKTN